MVQYKRKPVKFQPPPPFLDDNTEVWVIEATGEVFADYERYLARRDFYQQKKFTCDVTGHSGYTFFEALDSEMESTKEIDSYFPEALRERVLNFVQFNRTSRMDDLVNLVFEKYKEDYIVGDRVVVDEHGTRQHGVIRDITDPNPKARFMPDGTPMESSKPIIYYIMLDGSAEEIIKTGSKEFCRDRKVYSKLVLKSFLRNSITREGWSGAPWVVKEKIANDYKISTKVPETMTRDAVMAQKKAAAAQTAQSVPAEHGGTFLNFLASHTQTGAAGKPAVKGQRKLSAEDFTRNRQQQVLQMPPHINGRLPPFLPMAGTPHLSHDIHPNFQHGPGLPISLSFQNQFMPYQMIAPTTLPPAPAPPPPAPPVKYPIEDLELQPRRNGTQRPPLKFFSDDVPAGAESSDRETGVLMKSMGPLLCTWETLNVHDEVFHLDSFTFDDFVDAMRFSHEEVECELFAEVHCATLKQLVDETGKVQVGLPNIEDQDDESESGEEPSTPSSPEPEIEAKPPVRTTRSSLAKSEAAALARRSPSVAEPRLVHRAAEFLNEFKWVDQCKERDFKNGGWQAIMVGIIHNVSFIPGQKEVCEKILTHLVPVDTEPTLESIRLQYVSLDVNLRVAALEIACMLAVRTDNFRNHLSSASEEMTTIRKEKIEYQRNKKILVEELLQLDQTRKILLPANMPSSPPPEANETPDVTMTGTEDGQEVQEGGSSSEEEPRNISRTLRHTKSLKRKREEEEARKERLKKEKAEAAKSKQSAEWKKLLKDIEKKKAEIKHCEDMINEQDDDLREAAVQRSKYLGKDRFMNRYYWFERNGMPYGGLQTSSTAEYGYANGRLWVQGPDKTEMAPLITEPILSGDREAFGITVPERREKDEGPTRLGDSVEWGYYDDPEDIDKLIAWLDERGNREKVLRKELQSFREPIIEYMGKMKEHRAEVEQNKADGDDSATRVSTRTKTYVDLEATKDQCLLWTNSIAREQFGHIHSEQPRPKKQRRGEPKVKVPVGKNGKPLTRQGTRYGRL